MNPQRAKNYDLRMRFLINGLAAVSITFFIFLSEVRPLRWIFAAAIATVGATAVWEFDQLIKKKGLFPATILSIIAVISYIFAVFFKMQGPYPSFWSHTPEIVLGMAFFGCFVYFSITGQSPLTNIATSFLGIVYIGVPLGLFVRILLFFTFQGLQDPYFEGSWWIIYLIGVTKSADVGGYFIGRRFGKRKLAFKLSPNKTFEGALGGLGFAILVSLLICFLGKHFGSVFSLFSYVQALWLGILTGGLGQIGDLAESLLKRDARVKDSNSIPGVGGILDMVDSLLFTAPVIYMFLRIFYT